MGIYIYSAMGTVVAHSGARHSHRSVSVDVSGQGYDVMSYLLWLPSFLFCMVARFSCSCFQTLI